jgi:hypothetical protein
MMETRQPDPPGDRKPRARKQPNGFVMITPARLAIPLARRGQAGEVDRLTPLEWKVMVGLATDMWKFGGRSRMTNMEIGLVVGMDGDGDKIALKIRRILMGRPRSGKREPGLLDKGFVRIYTNTNPRNPWQREIEYTSKWLEASRIKVAAAEPREPVAAPASAATAAITSSELAAQGEIPTAEQRDEVFGRLPRILTRAELAHRLVTNLRNRGMVLDLVDGAIKPRRVDAKVEPLSTAEAAVLKWLREEVVAELLAGVAEKPHAEAKPKTAPRVANQAEIRALIGKLTTSPPGEDADCLALAARLASEFHDQDPERSRQTYLGIALSVKKGELAEHIVIEAFEEACKPRKLNRGATFIAEVKRLVAFHLKASEGKN